MNETLQLFPALDAATEAALRASIHLFGVILPVVKDQHGRIIDGHQRDRIARELDVPYDTLHLQVATEEEARAIAHTLNADRRQLTPEQRREVAVALRQEGHSYPAIGKALGVHHTTIMRDVATGHTPETCAGAQVVQPSRIIGIDGKSRPATRPLLEPREARPAPEPDNLEAGIAWCPYCHTRCRDWEVLSHGTWRCLLCSKLSLHPAAVAQPAVVPAPAGPRTLREALADYPNPVAASALARETGKIILDKTGHWQSGLTEAETATGLAYHSILTALETLNQRLDAAPDTASLVAYTPVYWHANVLQWLPRLIPYLMNYHTALVEATEGVPHV
jgi:hypothetical protein